MIFNQKKFNIIFIELDANDDKYIEVLRQPWFNKNRISDNHKIESVKYFR